MKCYICDTDITVDNETDEHIIINAAGGRLKSKELICGKCNTDFGETIDSILAKQLNNMANMLMVKRHRGEPQPILGVEESTGEKFFIDVGGKPKLAKPKINKTVDGEKTNISITARTMSEVKHILTGLAKKHPHFNVEEVIKSAKVREEYFDKALQFQNEVGGLEVFRAVCKCATNFYIYCKGDPKHIKHLIPYIKGDVSKEIVWLHYQDNLYDLDSNECFHIIYLVGNSKEKVLYCYVDYFNTHKYLVLLNDNYMGQDIKQTYFFDILNITRIERKVNMDYDRKTLLSFFTNKDANPFEKAQKSFEHSIGLGLKIQDDNHRSKLIQKAIQGSLGKYPNGTIITEQMINETVNEIMKNLTPYLPRRMMK